MKTLLWLAISASVFLTGCVTRTSTVLPEIDPFLQECRVEGKHPTLDAVMTDENSVTYDIYVYAGEAEDALARCNADKKAIKEIK